MLALKVVLAGALARCPTLVFDEVDSGIGGATAAAVGERLARVAERVQVLLVTHSPQVAARGAAHLRVAKRTAAAARETLVEPLDGGARREEIARMLAGETVTDAARAAADSLLEHAGMSRGARAATGTTPADGSTRASAAAELARLAGRDRPARRRLSRARRAAGHRRRIRRAARRATPRSRRASRTWCAPDSPARGSAARRPAGFAKLRHGVPMLSLDNVFDRRGFRRVPRPVAAASSA